MLSTAEKIQKIRKKYPNITITIPTENSGNLVRSTSNKEQVTAKEFLLKDDSDAKLLEQNTSDYVGTIIKAVPETTMTFPAEYGLFIDTIYTVEKLEFDGVKVNFEFITSQKTTVPCGTGLLQILKICKAAPSIRVICKNSLTSEYFKKLSNEFKEKFWESCDALIITGNWRKSALQIFTNMVPINVKTLIMREFTVTETYELQCLRKENVQQLRHLSFDCRCTSSKDIVQNVNILCGQIQPNRIHRLYLNVTGYPVFKKQGQRLVINRMGALINQLEGITSSKSIITILTEEHVDNEIHENLFDNNFTYVGTVKAKKALYPFTLSTYHLYEYDGDRSFTFGMLARS